MASACGRIPPMPAFSNPDVLLFEAINQGLASPVLDFVMPLLSGNAAFFPLVAVLAVVMIRQGGLRGGALVIMSVLAVLVASNLVCEPLRQLFLRPRPAMVLDHVRLIIGNGRGLSMPSCHATNWGALVLVAWLYHRPTWKFMLPLALLVALSRVYLGVHYPSDVLAGLLLGAATGTLVVLSCTWLWQTLGRRFFPAWWASCPSLLKRETPILLDHLQDATSRTWRNATWLLILTLFLGRLAYIASDIIELGEDEAYQWMWSQRLDWAYYSKPPMIAWVQWLGTHLWGNTAFGVRFFSPVLAFVFSIMVWAFLRRRADERTAFWTIVVFAVTPLFAVGSTLLTVDAPTVFFYTASILTVWLAMERDSTAWWAAAGLCMALGFLSKFFSPFLWVGLSLFLIWAPEHRRQLRRPGLWLALLLNLLGVIPVLIWNSAHNWITLTHLQERGGLDHGSSFSLTTLGTFAGSVFGLLNPVFFIAILISLWGFIKLKEKPLLWRFLFCASVPVFLFYLALSCHAKAQPNWIGPAAPALFLFAVLWWHQQSLTPSPAPARWLLAGLAFGLPVVLFLHDTHLLGKAVGIHLSDNADPLNRVRGGSEMADIVQEQRNLLAKEGLPVFLIADHYGRASLLNFYMPEASALLPAGQLSYVLSTDKPQSQYWFWPSYADRVGENALFIANAGTERKSPKRLRAEFESVKSLGVFKVRRHGRICGQIQIFACRGKLPSAPAPAGWKPHLTSTN